MNFLPIVSKYCCSFIKYMQRVFLGHSGQILCTPYPLGRESSVSRYYSLVCRILLDLHWS